MESWSFPFINDEARRFDKHRVAQVIRYEERGMCRILFKDDLQAQVELELKGNVNQAYGNWFKEVKGFYTCPFGYAE